jgi:hypothetical protein
VRQVEVIGAEGCSSFRDGPGGLPGRCAAFLLAVCLALVACAGVPAEQLNSYADALDQAAASGSEVYLAMVPALAEVDTTLEPEMPFRTSLGSPVFVRGPCQGELATYPALLARCQALAAVTAYDQALVLLAQGRTADAVGPQLQAFYDSASSLASLVPDPRVTAVFATAGVIFPAVKTIADAALRAVDAAQVRARLEEGEPQVRALLQVLQADVPGIYQVQYRYYENRLNAAQSDIDRSVNRLKGLAVSHAAPLSPALAAERRALDARFDRIFVDPEPGFGGERLSRLGPDPGVTAPFDGETVAAMSSQLDGIERSVGLFKEQVEAWRRFRAALMAYDQMLTDVDIAFGRLLAATANPFASGGSVSQALATAFTIRDQAREIRMQLAARRAL